jgi:hypothetical protein
MRNREVVEKKEKQRKETTKKLKELQLVLVFSLQKDYLFA